MQLPNSSPTEFCVAFIERELKSFKETPINMSSWEIMERMIRRANELKRVYDEIINEYGYSDKFDMSVPDPKRQAPGLILELITNSSAYLGERVAQARKDRAEISRLNDKIVDLAVDLANTISEQKRLISEGGFSCGEPQNAMDILVNAARDNGHYSIGPKDEVDALNALYECKYWPTGEDLVNEIGMFQSLASTPSHHVFSESTLNGKKSAAKDFILTFDKELKEMVYYQLPSASRKFKFSNNAMADIYNVILNKEPGEYIDGDTVRKVRHRQAMKNSSLRTE